MFFIVAENRGHQMVCDSLESAFAGLSQVATTMGNGKYYVIEVQMGQLLSNIDTSTAAYCLIVNTSAAPNASNVSSTPPKSTPSPVKSAPKKGKKGKVEPVKPPVEEESELSEKSDAEQSESQKSVSEKSDKSDKSEESELSASDKSDISEKPVPKGKKAAVKKDNAKDNKKAPKKGKKGKAVELSGSESE